MYQLIINNDNTRVVFVSTITRSLDPNNSTSVRYYLSGTIEGEYNQSSIDNLTHFALTPITDVSVLDAESQQKMHITSNDGQLIALIETLDGLANNCFFNIKL